MARQEAYAEYVEPIRSELLKLARAGRLTYYKDLGAIVGKPARWTLWKPVLDQISYDRPDISVLVLNAKTGWPGQIAYEATSGLPSDSQKKSAQDELARVFAEYCPDKALPKLPRPRNTGAKT